MVFKIGKNNFILSNDRIKYNALKREFITLAAWGRDEFKKEFKENFTDIEKVISGVRVLANKIIEDGILRGFDVLLKENVRFDEADFKKEYYEKYPIFESVFNTFMEGNYSFRNPNTLALFLNGIEESILSVHELVAIYIGKEYPHSISKPITKEDCDIFEEIYKELETNKDKIIDLLKLNPYDKRAYVYIFKTFGDEKKEVENLCKMLDVDFAIIKRELIDEKFNSLDFSNEEKAIESKKAFNDFIKYVSYENVEYYLKIIEDKLKHYNKLFCIVNGIEFISRDEAIIAKEEKAFIEEKITSIKKECESELTICRDKILSRNLKTKVKDAYLNDLEERINKSIYNKDNLIIEECVIINDIKTEEDVKVAIEKLNKLEVRTKELVKNKLEEIENKKSEIVEELDKELVEGVINSYLFLNIERVYEAIDEVAELEVRTEWVKETACELLTNEGEKLVREHRDLLCKAKKYEERLKNKDIIKEDNKVIGFLKKIFKNKLEEYDKNKEEIERDAWEFITDSGNRNLEDIE
ncbi:MAG: hypothetical protein ACRC2K_01945 [Clostridium sp.]